MIDELKRNGSGYYDPTAYQAMKNIKEYEQMEVKRGDIYNLIKPDGTEEKYLVISSDERKVGIFASVLRLVENDELVYGAKINCQGRYSVACDLVMYTKKDYFRDFIKCATADEMEEVDKMIAKALGLAEMGETESYRAAVDEVNRLTKMNDDLLLKLREAEAQLKETEKKIPVFQVEIEKELLKVETQRDMYKELYEQMFEKMIG